MCDKPCATFKVNLNECEKSFNINLGTIQQIVTGDYIAGDGIEINGNEISIDGTVCKILYYNSKFEFPNIGNISYLYIIKDTYDIYAWNEEDLIYTPLGLTAENFGNIIGGSASTVYNE